MSSNWIFQADRANSCRAKERERESECQEYKGDYAKNNIRTIYLCSAAQKSSPLHKIPKRRQIKKDRIREKWNK